MSYYTKKVELRIKLLFIMPANLKTGRSIETVLFNLLKHKPDSIITVIAHTEIHDIYRLSEEDIRELTKESEIIKIKGFPKTSNHIHFIYEMLLKKSMLKNNREKLKLDDIDIVYLFENEYSAIFTNKNDIPVIGSQHMSYGKAFTKNFFPYSYYYKIYLKNINGYHAFPQTKDIFDKHYFQSRMILSNGVDTSLFYPDYKLKNGKLKFLFVAGLTMAKGFDILLPLINKFKDNNNLEFHIAGGHNGGKGKRK